MIDVFDVREEEGFKCVVLNVGMKLSSSRSFDNCVFMDGDFLRVVNSFAFFYSWEVVWEIVESILVMRRQAGTFF